MDTQKSSRDKKLRNDTQLLSIEESKQEQGSEPENEESTADLNFVKIKRSKIDSLKKDMKLQVAFKAPIENTFAARCMSGGTLDKMINTWIEEASDEHEIDVSVSQSQQDEYQKS